ncbi:MAG: 30S ribosomal protein S3 [Bacilli bacterium]|nr:30S ribosomal protein S3 [Bacilli bacterium]
MGQKVSPVGLRIGINRDWEANWYANKSDFSKYLENDLKIRKFLDKKLSDAGVSTIEIERNTKRCEIVIHTSKPGVIIGKGGEEIENLKKEISKLVKEDVQISIVDIKKPDLDATLVADSIAAQIENRASFRMAQKKAIRNVMKAGAKGVKTLVSGRLNGADIARSEGYSEGTIPLHTLRANVDYATAEADTTFGKIGVKVWIYKGEILQDKKAKGGN